ncbi:MAG: tRNA (adenosine(37)-N6)-threonylcarbamoyltransferase complex transferase subunit TsaD [Vicinamibacterales bacterium]|jgi:N6-L-threonylcarbamoyladenine synthase|nr:tRNA (adenosine(37)-N6)-threonylcarbamoyltransferase complex transferase subunit TsaD [Acidobacteriota bacterium]MDP7295443.1 tRNA (adenosine(37)-N6)-threonylcarbamoyltransferase complex transferase subunit TsaD [Vicinamibacterales bacterium]MDP7471176.1 tRNA (adenosine(37)-N6)-threonylcarbamoyltransferase complex transferase subunit TsaD [Vicinamibacterales bacterium]MDP7671817.1 tRNA (adenosine(37)-N6)-threonylcarbamoyltransferase complex transferase subunit TsaD [Vicinamibacterales bacteri
MRILGVETSCDETAAAVVVETAEAERPWAIASSVIASQVEIHREWGGIVPELASRQHVRDICGVTERALSDAELSWTDLDAVAVTQGPGLVGSLLVGVAFAKSVALTLGVPLVPVHHLAGHIESLFLHNGALPLPAVVLVVSGGHTCLYLVLTPGTYQLVGRTRDDAAGEAFDKVGKVLGLTYPGGPVVDRLARTGNPRAVDFPVARITHRDRIRPPTPGYAGQEGMTDFSFSGIKTAVKRHVAARLAETGAAALPEAELADVCASFQRAVVDALLDRTFEAAQRLGARSVGIAGGVSANSRLREDAAARGDARRLPVFLPTLALSTDNAAMIAAAGLRQLARGVTAAPNLNANASLSL